MSKHRLRNNSKLDLVKGRFKRCLTIFSWSTILKWRDYALQTVLIDEIYVFDESMARDEHKLKMQVLKLKEWKLMHQCDNMGIGLPPAYNTDEEGFCFFLRWYQLM